jgi:hypothetical protein
MDQLFRGNRGIVCIASFTKLETQMLPGEPEVRMMMVPVEVNGEKRIWRIEIPGEILLLPLLYIAIRLAPGSSGGGTIPVDPAQPPAGAGPNPTSSRLLIPPKKRTPTSVPPGPPPPHPVQAIKPPREVGQAQDGYWQRPERIKQPNVKTNFHNSGHAGHRARTRHDHQGKNRNRSKNTTGGSRNGSR